jgi:hypothetical protein
MLLFNLFCHPKGFGGKRRKKITNTQIQEELRAVLTKIEGSIRMLVDGKQVPTYHKLIGIRDKVGHLIQKLDMPEENGCSEVIEFEIGTVDEKD